MAFYQCPNCKRVWQYPIERCPDCLVDLERMESKNIRVVGSSRVFIPTIFHQTVPYFVLLLEDEEGNRWVQKSFREYRPGDVFDIESGEGENNVSLWRIKYDIFEAISRVVELLGGLRVENDLKILILPTLVSAKHPYFAENTSPEFLEGIIKYLLEKGAEKENIKVAGQSFNEVPINASAQKSQILRVCQEKGILPLDLSQGKFIKKGKLEISEEALRADLIVNLPILGSGKAQATINLLKLLEKKNYLGQKYLLSDKEIFEGLKNELPPVLTVAEADSVQKTDGFVAQLGLSLASYNPLYLDRVFAEISQTSLPEVLKDVRMENIKILGRKVEEVQYSLEKYG